MKKLSQIINSCITYEQLLTCNQWLRRLPLTTKQRNQLGVILLFKRHELREPPTKKAQGTSVLFPLYARLFPVLLAVWFLGLPAKAAVESIPYVDWFHTAQPGKSLLVISYRGHSYRFLVENAEIEKPGFVPAIVQKLMDEDHKVNRQGAQE